METINNTNKTESTISTATISSIPTISTQTALSRQNKENKDNIIDNIIDNRGFNVVNKSFNKNKDNINYNDINYKYISTPIIKTNSVLNYKLGDLDTISPYTQKVGRLLKYCFVFYTISKGILTIKRYYNGLFYLKFINCWNDEGLNPLGEVIEWI